MWSESAYHRMIFMFLHGVLLAGYINAYILATEIIPKKYLVIVTSVNIICDQTLN